MTGKVIRFCLAGAAISWCLMVLSGLGTGVLLLAGVFSTTSYLLVSVLPFACVLLLFMAAVSGAAVWELLTDG